MATEHEIDMATMVMVAQELVLQTIDYHDDLDSLDEISDQLEEMIKAKFLENRDAIRSLSELDHVDGCDGDFLDCGRCEFESYMAVVRSLKGS